MGYLSRVAIPSLLSANSSPEGEHRFNPVEQDANYRAFLYFNRKVSGFYKSEQEYYSSMGNGRGWDFIKNPLGNIKGKYWDYKNSEHLNLLKSLKIRVNAFDYFTWIIPPFSFLTAGYLNYSEHSKIVPF